MNHTQTMSPRLPGLDLARYFALIGMVFVNFKLAMHPATPTPTVLAWLFKLLEGKASATFVMLAGVGLSFATRKASLGDAWGWIVRRALFLLAVGLLNLLVFPADIIHYYAVYFMLALPLLQADRKSLVLAILLVSVVSSVALSHLDYSQGWDWDTLTYHGLWQAEGFVRNLLFNGFHPVLPWIVFFWGGMLLARLSLERPSTQWGLILAGIVGIAAANLVSLLGAQSSWAWALNTTPIPPGPAYLLMGTGSALLCIGVCLRLTDQHPPFFAAVIAGLLPAGRMTLTLYLAHILLGMGWLEAIGALDGTWTLTQSLLASLAFIVIATACAWWWSRRFAHGPVEALMRKVTASGT